MIGYTMVAVIMLGSYKWINGCGWITSKLIIALYVVEHSQQGMVVQVVLVLQLFLHLFTTDLIPAALAQIHVVSIEVGICSASQAYVTGLSKSASSSAAITAERMPVFLLGDVFGLVVVAESFHRDLLPGSEQQHGVFLIVEVVSLLGGWFFDAVDASEVGALLPFEPVVGEGECGVALPTGGALGLGHIDSLHCVDLELLSMELVIQGFNGVVVALVHIGFDGSLLREHSLLKGSHIIALDAEQFCICEIGLDELFGEVGGRIGLYLISRDCLLGGGWGVCYFLILSDQLIDPVFQVDGGGVAGEVDLAELINQADEGDAADGEVADQLVLILPAQESEMLDLAPSLGVHSLLDGLLLLIDADSHDAHLASPGGFVLDQHFLVVLHGALAGPAPGGPHVHQQHLSLLVLQLRNALIEHILNLPVITEGTAHGQGLLDVHQQSLLVGLEQDGVEFLLGHVLAEASLDNCAAAFSGLGHAGPFLEDYDVLLCEGGLAECLVVFEDLQELLHKICLVYSLVP